MSESADDRRAYLHSLVVAEVRRGATRVDAFRVVAEQHRIRMGVVAAAYHRVEREAGR